MYEAYYANKHIAKLSVKLDDLRTAPEMYLSIVSRFLRKRKMLAIPPDAHGKLVYDFQIKSELFNSHFAAQRTPVKMQARYQSLSTEPI